jgi:hypothetical protein
MTDVLAFPEEIPNNGGKPYYLANPQIQWSGYSLSGNINITMRDVVANPQIE